MVKALHRAGIEVILDVVYNHTAEDSDDGPTLSLRGIDNRIYYLLDPANRAEYVNDSGVGNTLNGNHTVVRRMILDSLRYWVQEMHVDGFRFDLASVLYRGQENEVLTGTTPAVGHRLRSCSGGYKDHCRSLGCRRTLPGRFVRWRPVGGVERPLSGHGTSLR